MAAMPVLVILTCLLLAGCSGPQKTVTQTVTETVTVTASSTVSNNGPMTNKAPSMGATQDSTNSKVTITTASSGYTWDSIAIYSDKAVSFNLNAAAAGGTSVPAGGSAQAGPATAHISGGDYFAFCGTGSQQNDVTVQFVHKPTNTQVYTTTFRAIAAC